MDDPRLLVDVCAAHHVEEAPVPLPDGWSAAVVEYGLEGDLPRWLGSRWDALRRGQGAIVSDMEMDRIAARQGYNPNR